MSTQLSKKDLLVVFLLAIVIRGIILLVTYIAFGFENYYALDVEVHRNNLQDFIEGTFFQFDNYNKGYSPVPSFIVSILTFPLIFTTIDYYYMIFTGLLLMLGSNSVGILVYGEKIGIKRRPLVILAILNPIDIIGILFWIGLAMAITTTAITWMLVLYRNIIEKGTLRSYEPVVIVLLILASVSSHRTGFVIFFTYFLIQGIYIIAQREMNMKWLLGLLGLLLVILVSFGTRAISLANTHLKNTIDNLNWDSEGAFITYLRFLFFVLFLITIPLIMRKVNFMDTSILNLNHPEKLMLLTSLILFFIPILEITDSMRFITAINIILAHIFLSPLSNQYNWLEGKRIDYYTVLLYILSLLSIPLSIILAKRHIVEWILP